MEYTLKFNDPQMQLLQMALDELPMKLARPMFQHINQQVAEQQEHQATAETGDGSASVDP